MRFARRPAPPDPASLLAGERVLARGTTAAGEPVGGSRDALHLPGGVRLVWEQVAAADWDAEAEVLRVLEVAPWGAERAAYDVALADPGRLLELTRERVTASIVLSRHVPLRGRRGVRVVARRAPSGRGPLHWVLELDDGIDPDDPFVRQAAEEALITAREEVGDA